MASRKPTKKTTPAPQIEPERIDRIVEDLVADLSKRGGLGEVWGEILPQQKEQIKKAWAGKIRQAANEALTP
jgi:hypothetical protein